MGLVRGRQLHFQRALLRVFGVRHHCLMADSPATLPEPVPEPSSPAPDTLVQYVVVRKDLSKTWPLGSIITQACHASCAALWLSRDTANTQAYCKEDQLDHMTKVTLEIKNEGQLRKLSKGLAAAGVGHKLWIEEPEMAPTALATFPVWRREAQSLFKKCQLYKG